MATYLITARDFKTGHVRQFVFRGEYMGGENLTVEEVTELKDEKNGQKT